MSEKLTVQRVDEFHDVLLEMFQQVNLAGMACGDEPMNGSLIAIDMNGLSLWGRYDFGQRKEREWTWAHFVHDPERDRAELRDCLRAIIAEAGEAGEGLRVVEGEPEKPTTDATVILRPTGEVDVYSLHGGGHEGEWVKWMPSREFAICYPGGKTWTAERLVLFDSQTVLADGDECEDITAYLAAIPGDWRLEGE